jgi:hypothetical protein
MTAEDQSWMAVGGYLGVFCGNPRHALASASVMPLVSPLVAVQNSSKSSRSRYVLSGLCVYASSLNLVDRDFRVNRESFVE